MTEPEFRDAGPEFSRMVGDTFREIAAHVGDAFPPPDSEVDISVSAAGRITFGIGRFSFYLLNGMAVRAQRSEDRSVVVMFQNGQCIGQRVVLPNGDFAASHETASSN
jgi:hypothetical protein